MIINTIDILHHHLKAELQSYNKAVMQQDMVPTGLL